MSMEERVIDRLVELARNPTRDDMAAMDRMLNEARAKCDRLQRDRDKAFAEKVAAEPYIKELYSAAEGIVGPVNAKIHGAPALHRLRAAIKGAQPHIDLIPF